MSHGVLVCYREHPETGCITTECTLWSNAAQARQAEAELTPCSPACIGVHSVAPVELELGRAAGTRPPGAAGRGRVQSPARP